jgi:hypothetical protein
MRDGPYIYYILRWLALYRLGQTLGYSRVSILSSVANLEEHDESTRPCQLDTSAVWEMKTEFVHHSTISGKVTEYMKPARFSGQMS